MKVSFRVAYFAIMIAVLCGASFGQLAEGKGIWKATPLSYPAVARLAQIQGDVKLNLLIDKTGRIASVSRIEGPDALAVTAAKEIQGWHYTASDQTWHAMVVIHYSLQKPASAVVPVARVAINTPFNVNVASNYPLPTGNPEVITPK
jgi:hypothetical protein